MRASFIPIGGRIPGLLGLEPLSLRPTDGLCSRGPARRSGKSPAVAVAQRKGVQRADGPLPGVPGADAPECSGGIDKLIGEDGVGPMGMQRPEQAEQGPGSRTRPLQAHRPGGSSGRRRGWGRTSSTLGEAGRRPCLTHLYRISRAAGQGLRRAGAGGREIIATLTAKYG
jgi:hypothetical protein